MAEMWRVSGVCCVLLFIPLTVLQTGQSWLKLWWFYHCFRKTNCKIQTRLQRLFEAVSFCWWCSTLEEALKGSFCASRVFFSTLISLCFNVLIVLLPFISGCQISARMQRGNVKCIFLHYANGLNELLMWGSEYSDIGYIIYHFTAAQSYRILPSWP